MANETVISVRTNVSGLGELEKANELINKLKSSASELGKSFSMKGSTSVFITPLEKANELTEKLAGSMKRVNEAMGQGSGASKIVESFDKGVAGADKLANATKKVNEILEQGSGASKLINSFDKGIAGADKLSSAVKRIDEGLNQGSGASKLAEGFEKSTSAAEKLNSQLREAESLEQRVASISEKVASNSAKSATDSSKVASSSGKFESSSAKANTSWGKISGALKDSFAMFSIGMLGASAVNSAAEGIKNVFKGGYESIKEQQSGQAMWATSIQDAHRGVTGANLTRQASSASDATMATAIKAGNSFEEATAIAKQIYSSSAGDYSGNVGKTEHMLKGMFNIQDANALSDREMLQFRTAVGNIGDLGKLNGNSMKSLNLLDGKIGQAIRKEYKRRTGHALGKNKTGNYDWGKVDAETAFAGIDKYGNSGGLAKASDRYNNTLGGVTRSIKNGTKYMAGKFITGFTNEINSALGGKGGLLSKVSGFFTDQGKMKKVADGFSKSAGSVANTIGHVGKEFLNVGKDIAPTVSKFSKGFAKGFVDEITTIGNGIKNAYNGIKGLASKFSDMIPDGVRGKLGDLTSKIGTFFGKLTAFGLAIRGFSKLPGLAKAAQGFVRPFESLIKKVPLVGKAFSGLIEKITGIKNNPVQSQFKSAVNEFKGAVSEFKSMTGKNSSSQIGGKALSEAEQFVQGGGVIGSGLQVSNGQVVKASPLTRMFDYGSILAEKGGKFGRIKTAIGNGLMKNASWLQGHVTRIQNSALGKVGSAVISGLGKFGSGVAATGRSFVRSGGLMTAMFGGLDLANTLASTKAGTATRHKAVGGSVGSTLGGIAGGMIGSLPIFGGPGVGTAIGGMIGSGIGQKVGNWAGSLFGSSKVKPTKSISKMQSNAQAVVDRQNGIAGLQQMGVRGQKANATYSVLGRASSIKNQKAQTFAAQAQNAYSNGDVKSGNEYTVKAAKQTAQYSAKAASSAKSKLNTARAEYADAKKLTKYMTKAQAKPAISKAKKSLNKAQDKYDSAAKRAKKDRDAVDKLTGSKKRNTSATKKNTDETKKNSSETKKNGKAQKKSSKDSSKALSGLTKKQAKELRKQNKNLQNANKKQTKLAKDAAKDLKKAKSKAAKDIAKADKKAAKALSKNYKTASKQMGKAIKQGMKSASKEARKGAKDIAKNAKKGLKNIGKDTKKSFKGFDKAIKSSMKTAKKNAKSGAKSIGKSIKSGLKNVGKQSKSAFKGLSKSVKSGMKSAKSAAKSGAKGIANAVKSGLKNAGKSGKTAFNTLARSVKSGMNKAKSSARSGARGIVSAVKSGMSKVGSAGRSGINKLASSVRSGMNKAKSSARSGANGIVSAVRSGMSKMRSVSTQAFNQFSSGARSGMSKAKAAITAGMSSISSAITSGMNKAKSTFTSTFNSMASSASSATRRVASSMSSIGSAASAAAGKVRALQSAIAGLKSKTVTITVNLKGKGASKLETGTPGAVSAFSGVPHLANGTTHLAGGWSNNGGARAGIYMVNDAPGSDYREAFKLRNGLVGIFPKKRNILAPIPEGTQVLNAVDTKKMFPHLKKGTPGAKGSMGGSGNGGKVVVNITVNVSGTAQASDANTIANEIGEKFRTIFPLKGA